MATLEKRVAIMVTTLPAGDHLREENGQKCPTMATRGCHENGLPCRVAMPRGHKKTASAGAEAAGPEGPFRTLSRGFKTKS